MQNLNSHEKLMSEIKLGNIMQCDSNENNFRCVICNCHISGQAQAESHAIGMPHEKKLRHKHSASQLSSILSPKNDPDETPSVIAINGSRRSIGLNSSFPKDFYCSVCDVSLTGEIPYFQHINGKQHIKKVGLSQISYSNDVSPERLYKPVPSPRSSISLQTLAINNKDVQNTLQSVNDMDGMEFCNICNVSLTGRIPMEQHLTGKAHLRRVMLNLKGRDSATSRTSLSPSHFVGVELSAKTEPLNINDDNYPTKNTGVEVTPLRELQARRTTLQKTSSPPPNAPTRKTPVEVVTPLTLRELQARRTTLQTSSPPKATSDVPISTVKANEPIPHLF